MLPGPEDQHTKSTGHRLARKDIESEHSKLAKRQHAAKCIVIVVPRTDGSQSQTWLNNAQTLRSEIPTCLRNYTRCGQAIKTNQLVGSTAKSWEPAKGAAKEKHAPPVAWVARQAWWWRWLPLHAIIFHRRNSELLNHVKCAGGAHTAQ